MLCKLMPKQGKASPFAPHATTRSQPPSSRRTLSLDHIDQEAIKPARQSTTTSAVPPSEASRQGGADNAKAAAGRQRQEARMPRSRLGELQLPRENTATSQQQCGKGSAANKQVPQQASGTPVSSHPLSEGVSARKAAPLAPQGPAFPKGRVLYYSLYAPSRISGHNNLPDNAQAPFPSHPLCRLVGG